MARTRQDIEQVFARLGIGQQTSLPGLSGVSGSSLPKLPGLGGESPLMQSTASPTPPTGFMQQLGYGLTSPIRMGGERLGLMDASPAPTSIGGWAGNILGSLVGWGAVTALTMATFGAGAVALLGIPAGTFAATAVSAGVSGGLVGAYGGWAKDEGVDEIIKGAAIGAATDLAFLGAGKAIRGLKNAKALKVDTALAVSKGLDPTDVLGQYNPSRLSTVLESMQPEIVDDIFAKTAKIAQKYNLGPQQAKYMGTKEKLKYLGELVNNFNTYDKDIYQPLAQYANDLLLRGKYSSLVVKGEATSLGRLGNNVKRVLQQTAPDTTQGDYKTHESRLWKEYRAVIARTKALGGNVFRKVTGIKEVDDLLKNPEKAASEGRFVRIAYMTPNEFGDFATELNNTPIERIPVWGPGKAPNNGGLMRTGQEALDMPLPPGITDKAAVIEARKYSYPDWLKMLADKPEVNATYDDLRKNKTLRLFWMEATAHGNYMEDPWVVSQTPFSAVDDVQFSTVFESPQVEAGYTTLGRFRYHGIDPAEKKLYVSTIAPKRVRQYKTGYLEAIGEYFYETNPELKNLVDSNPGNALGQYHKGHAKFYGVRNTDSVSKAWAKAFGQFLTQPSALRKNNPAAYHMVQKIFKAAPSLVDATNEAIQGINATGMFNFKPIRLPKGTVVTESAEALAKAIADPKGKKLNMPVLDFEKGLIEGANYVEAAKQAGIKGIPVAVLTPDPDHPAFQSIPLHDDLDQLPLLLKRLGVEDELIDNAIQRALPFDQKESVWDQMVTLENEIRGANRGIKAIYERNKVSSFEELNQELQRHFVLLEDAQGDPKARNAIRRKIKSIQKDIESWKYYVEHTDAMDVRRQKLMTYVENVLGLEQRGQMESAINDLLPSDPNVTRVTKVVYREPVKNFLEKHKATSLRQVNWKSKPVRDEWKQIVAESRRTGIPLVDTMQMDQVTPTVYDRAMGIVKKLILAPEKELTTSDVEKLGKPFNPFSILDWLPRNRLTEPIFRRIRNADIQKREFVHSYKQAVADAIGKEYMKPTKAAREFRKQLARYLETPDLMDIDGVGDDIRTKVAKLRELFNILGAQEFKVEGWIDDEGKKYIPHIMKQYRNGTGFGLTPKDLRPGFKLERTGDMAEELREMDIWRLFSYYIEAGAREKFYQPVFDALDPLFGISPRKGAEVARGVKRIAHETQTQYYKHLKAKMIGVPDGVEQHFDAFLDKWLPDFAKEIMGIEGSERYTAQISGFLSELAYSGTLGYNPFSAIKNLTQQISAVAHLDDNPLVGIDYWWKARRMMSTKEGQQILENFNIVRTGRNPQEALDLQMLAMSNIPGIGKLQKGAFKMFQWADSQNIDTSWMMKFLYERDRGFALKEAVESAYSFTMATQFMYGIDSPLFFKGPVGKQLGMLMSWPLNFAAEIQQLGQTGEWNKAVIMLASYAFGAEALSMTGLSFRSIHPVEVAKGFLPVAMLEGDQNMPIPIRLLHAGYDWAKTWVGADEGEKEKAWDSLKRAARAFIPYSTQGKRILTTLEAARNDFKIHERTFLSQLTNSDNGKGRLKYEMTKAEAILGLIGPTTNANNRWQALNNLAASESAYRRLRAQAIDAFLKEDYELFMDKMTELRVRFGGKVNIRDIQQEIELRSMTNLERRATSLPEPMRKYFTN
jgi:hypothetical protein